MAVANFSFKTILFGLFMACALAIVLDFVMPGKEIAKPIISVGEEYQQYYNAAQNGHFSYRLKTSNHNFPVNESIASRVTKGDEVQVRFSLLFKEVNRYSKFGETSQHTYSLRYLTGLVIPLLAMIILCFGFVKRKFDILVFVFQVIHSF